MKNVNLKVSKPKLIMLSGLPASGKSTLAKELLAKYPNSFRLNKDSLREMCNFGKWSFGNEKVINESEEMLAYSLLCSGKTVIIDDTNLHKYHLDKWKKMCDGIIDCEFEVINLDTDWGECVLRDSVREKKVGKDVIVNFALEKGLVDGKLVLCDLDGTLCNLDKRRHFLTGEKKDWKSFFEGIPNDDVNMDVSDKLISLYNHGYNIIYVSARPEDYREETVAWLKKHNLSFNLSLIMRKSGDFRDDVIVKKQMLDKYFKNKKLISFIFDDRPKVLRMWMEEFKYTDCVIIDCGDGVEF